jgi:hypothetical protein
MFGERQKRAYADVARASLMTPEPVIIDIANAGQGLWPAQCARKHDAADVAAVLTKLGLTNGDNIAVRYQILSMRHGPRPTHAPHEDTLAIFPAIPLCAGLPYPTRASTCGESLAARAPNVCLGCLCLPAAYAQLGRLDEARTEAAEARSSSPSSAPRIPSTCSMVCARPVGSA